MYAFVWSYTQFGRNRLGGFVDETLRNGHCLPQTHLLFALRNGLALRRANSIAVLQMA